MKTRLKDLQAERARLGADADDGAEAELTILSHPSLPDLYRRKVEQLEAVLDGDDRTEAMKIIRTMIDSVELRPRANANGLDAVLHGDLAAILAACGGAKTENAPDLSASGRQLSMVAGTGFEPVTFRL
jgi:site-specific DNA recombinase